MINNIFINWMLSGRISQQNQKAKNDYSIAIQQISQLILSSHQTPQINTQILSILYSNRGALKSCISQEDAIDDLQTSLINNHLNHIAYFNLFSIHYKRQDKAKALQNLCCALSCLYLFSGRQKNNENDINKAIRFAENNLEARLTKCLIFIDKKNYNLAMNQIKWVLDLNPNNVKVIKIAKRLEQMLGTDLSQKSLRHEYIQENFQSCCRLQCSLYDEMIDEQDLDYQAQIKSKLADFNVKMNGLGSQGIEVISKNPQIYLFMNKIDNTSANQNSKRSIFQFELPANQARQDSESQNPNRKNRRCYSQKDSIKFSSQKMDNTGSLTLKGLDSDKSLSIKVERIELYASEQQKAKLTNIYCRFQYGELDQKNLINSASLLPKSKKQCETELQEEQRVLKIKVYNKQITAFKDKLIGEGIKQLTSAGKVQIQIYKSLQRLQQQKIGVVLLDIKSN